MHLLLMAALALVVFISITTLSTQGSLDRPQKTADAAVKVDQYRMFMFVADKYMKMSAPTGPGTVTVDWATMAASSVTPPAAKLLAMPPGWRVVRAADLSWVACTEMDERSVGALNQLLTAGVVTQGIGATIAPGDLSNTSVQLSNGGGGTASFVVLGSPSTASTLASLCN